MISYTATHGGGGTASRNDHQGKHRADNPPTPQPQPAPQESK